MYCAWEVLSEDKARQWGEGEGTWYSSIKHTEGAKGRKWV